MDESWQADSLSSNDQSFRHTAIVHVVKTNYTIAEIRNPQRTKHNSDGKTKYSLLNIALEAIRSRFTSERNYVAALIFDCHTLFSWPASFEEIIPSFMNTRPADTNYIGTDFEGDTYWIAANVHGIDWIY